MHRAVDRAGGAGYAHAALSEKTEDPTPKRLEHARREGNVAVSGALLQAVGLLVAAALLPAAVRSFVPRVSSMIRDALQPGAIHATDVAVERIGLVTLEIVGPILVAVAASVAVVGGIQTGGLLAWKRVAPDLSRLSPASLMRGLFSSRRAFAIVRALVGATAVLWLSWRRLTDHAADLARSVGRIPEATVVAATACQGLLRDIVVISLVLAAADFAITRRSWLSGLRMTKTEVQREHKESEGDPQMKAARERAWHEMTAAATVAAVKDATVVVVNPTHLANALRYREGEDEAPVLVAKGEGPLAERIIDAARAYGIPVVRDVPVARALAELSEGEAIPPALYEAVAIILQDLQEQGEIKI